MKTHRLKQWLLGTVALVAVAATVQAEPVQLDPALPGYSKTQGVAGNLNSIGSDTLNNLMTFWAEGFRKLYPNVNIQIEGKGSSTAPPALIEGTDQTGIGYKTSGVKALALAKNDAAEAFEPNYENVLGGKHPLGRMLYLYVAKQPNQPLPKMIEEFINYVLSKEGQEIVVKDGYLPLSAQVAAKQQALIK
ncbi:MAG: hypothetical protein P8X63_07860 [Desulfuromonadaceae bacterium]|jgi:ABC-type phosphate transport system substrate-binding protein